MASPTLFDRALIARRLGALDPNTPDFISSLVAADLGDRLLTITRSFSRALIMGPRLIGLPQSGQTAEAPFAFEQATTLVPSPGIPLIDPENLELVHTDYELIVSLLDLQVVNDVPGFLSRIRAHLRPDGLFLGAAIGGLSLTELREAFLQADSEQSGGAFARVAPFIEVRDAGGLLQRAGFAIPVADVETHVVRYADALALMRDLKGLGAANPLKDRPSRMAGKSLIGRAATAYADIAGDPDGRVRATLEIIWMSGWAPDPSQQKPLAPGSARTSLASVLGRKSEG
jgi:hypothetical protein